LIEQYRLEKRGQQIRCHPEILLIISKRFKSSKITKQQLRWIVSLYGGQQIHGVHDDYFNYPLTEAICNLDIALLEELLRYPPPETDSPDSHEFLLYCHNLYGDPALISILFRNLYYPDHMTRGKISGPNGRMKESFKEYLLLRFIRWLGSCRTIKWSEKGMTQQEILHFRTLLEKTKQRQKIVSQCVDCPLEIADIIERYLW
jgi:hypothetical protein